VMLSDGMSDPPGEATVEVAFLFDEIILSEGFAAGLKKNPAKLLPV